MMAHNLRKRVKCNNNGSTMVIVLIMLSFVMILATVVTSSTIMNLKMKVANKQSVKTFIHPRMQSMRYMLLWDRCHQTALTVHIRIRLRRWLLIPKVV